MTHPYNLLPKDGPAFWQPAVGARNPLEISDLWVPKWPLAETDAIATAGSCFAQHISLAIRKRGFCWVDAEPAPQGLPDDTAKRFGYGVFSFRTSNIYTTALLRQWVDWALGVRPMPAEVWTDGRRFFDPYRPTIEPGGFATTEEASLSRQETGRAVKRALEKATIFVFTLGLTEGWMDLETDTVFPMCPGTAAGVFDPARHVFRNFSYNSIQDDLLYTIDLARRLNPDLRFLLTVSPVPLTATASGHHVLVASTYSKSVLRAVAGDLAEAYDHVDYFPSYEIVSSPPFRGLCFKPNMREVSPRGVELVMEHFMGAQTTAKPVQKAPAKAPKPAPVATESNEDVVCEDALLGAFGR